jgi:hypothetical protein
VITNLLIHVSSLVIKVIAPSSITVVGVMRFQAQQCFNAERLFRLASAERWAISQFLPGAVGHDEGRANILDCPRRREAPHLGA